jgi:hypothetical protein
MSLATLPFAYLGWHYSIALRDFAIIAHNSLVFIYHFFSLPILLRTFFSPWRRLGESYKKGFYPGAWLETFILNVIMRLLGIFFRFWLVVFGLLALLVDVVLIILALLLWLVLPFAIIVLFVTGLNLLIS